MAVLHYVSAFGLADHLLFSRAGVLHLMLLDAGEQFSSWQCSSPFRFEADGVHKFEVVPVDVTLTHLFGHLFFLPACLLLPGLMVVVDHSTG